jgi:spermidine synthase
MNTASSHEAVLAKGVRIALENTRTIFEQQSAFQFIRIFENPFFGRCLVLDGVLQLTERDERAYHNTLVGVPLAFVRSRKSALVIGGGDGGIVRDLIKSGFDKVVCIEIDPDVVTACVSAFTDVCPHRFDSPNIKLVIGDAAQLLPLESELFDIIVIDSTDFTSNGPASSLFHYKFFAACAERLHPDGMAVMQGGIPFFYPRHIQAVWKLMKSVFPECFIYGANVPSFFGGTAGFCAGFKNSKIFSVQIQDNVLLPRSEIQKSLLCQDEIARFSRIPQLTLQAHRKEQLHDK